MGHGERGRTSLDCFGDGLAEELELRRRLAVRVGGQAGHARTLSSPWVVWRVTDWRRGEWLDDQSDNRLTMSSVGEEPSQSNETGSVGARKRHEAVGRRALAGRASISGWLGRHGGQSCHRGRAPVHFGNGRWPVVT